MSADEKAGSTAKEYEYIVSKKTMDTVKRVCGKEADEILKQLRTGQIVGRGVHTFRAQKNRITRRAAKAVTDGDGPPGIPPAGDKPPTGKPPKEAGKTD